MRLWMVFIAAGVFACADRRPGSDNTPQVALPKASQDADQIASMLAMLPPKIAAYDYKIAIAGNTSSNCIQDFVTKSSYPDPGAALTSAFWRIDKGNVIPHGHLHLLECKFVELFSRLPERDGGADGHRLYRGMVVPHANC